VQPVFTVVPHINYGDFGLQKAYFDAVALKCAPPSSIIGTAYLRRAPNKVIRTPSGTYSAGVVPQPESRE
jgi:hypothetical protein